MVNVGAFDDTGRMIGVVFETATPFDTPRRMKELLEWLEDARTNRQLHPLLIIAAFVVVFLAIHPFQDGNGRLSRVLTTLLLLQEGYVYVPYGSLGSVVEQSKEAHYLAPHQTQGTLLSTLAVNILDYAKAQGRVATRAMVREHGASANTLKSTFSGLVRKGLLVRHGGGRSTWYALPQALPRDGARVSGLPYYRNSVPYFSAI